MMFVPGTCDWPVLDSIRAEFCSAFYGVGLVSIVGGGSVVDWNYDREVDWFGGCYQSRGRSAGLCVRGFCLANLNECGWGMVVLAFAGAEVCLLRIDLVDFVCF